MVKKKKRRARLPRKTGLASTGKQISRGPCSPDCQEPEGLSAGWSRFGVAALGLFIVLIYLPAFSGGFVWDDRILTDSGMIQEWSGILRIWTPSEIKIEAHYWPVVYTTFWLEHKLWGFNPVGYHIINVLLHFANTLLLLRLLLRFKTSGAWVVAAVFAAHPAHVESVAWVIERKDLLSTLFYLTAFRAYIGFAEAPRPVPVTRYLLALGLFTAGLLSKSIVVTLPAALLIWHWWKSGRVTSQDLIRVLPFFLLALFITVADLSFFRSRESISFDYSMAERVLIAARALWFYAGVLVWPVELPVIYPRWDVSLADPLAWGYAVSTCAVLAALWFVRRVGRGPLAGVLFFAVTLSPTLGFVDYGYMQFSFVADRHQYLASTGLTAVLIGAAAYGARTLPGAARKAIAIAALSVLVLIGAMTRRQSYIYRNESTFYGHIVSLNPHARDAHYNLGSVLIKTGRYEEAVPALRTALEQRPDFIRAHSNLAVALILLNRLDEAERQLRRALEKHPDNSLLLDNLKALEWKRRRN